MNRLYNVFIEGIQGSGKSTLVNRLAQEHTEYRPYREGDLSPVELAWCAYLSEKEYQHILREYEDVAEEIRAHTMEEGQRRIVAYTRVFAERRAFYEHMESFEIYNGRIPFAQFREIILTRYRSLDTYGNLFECALFQNTIETMLLFYELPVEEIFSFYREVYEILKGKRMRLLYLETKDLRATIEQVKKERVNERGEEVWFDLVLRYFETSPFGKRHGCAGMEEYLAHLQRRVSLEKQIIEEIMGECTVILQAKRYDISELLR